MSVLPLGPAPAPCAGAPSFGDAVRARLAGSTARAPRAATPASGAWPASALTGRGAPPAAAPSRVFGEAAGRASRVPSPAAEILAAVEEARAHLDAALAEARRGRVFSAGELLALQARAYRAAQTLDLASRVVEQGAQSVRHAVNTQV